MAEDEDEIEGGDLEIVNEAKSILDSYFGSDRVESDTEFTIDAPSAEPVSTDVDTGASLVATSAEARSTSS